MFEMIVKVKKFLLIFCDKIFYCVFLERVSLKQWTSGHLFRLKSTYETKHVLYYRLKQIVKINQFILFKVVQ
jgi:hypothetical protein